MFIFAKTFEEYGLESHVVQFYCESVLGKTKRLCQGQTCVLRDRNAFIAIVLQGVGGGWQGNGKKNIQSRKYLPHSI